MKLDQVIKKAEKDWLLIKRAEWRTWYYCPAQIKAAKLPESDLSADDWQPCASLAVPGYVYKKDAVEPDLK